MPAEFAGRTPHASTAGQLLVATPLISDGTFDRGVVFMIHHDPAGALGVVLNQPQELSAAELLPRWAEALTAPGLLFTGGPVEPNGFIGLGQLANGAAPPDGVGPVSAGPCRAVSVDLDGDPALVAPSLAAMRIFRGYAGWDAGQLDRELRAGAWFAVEAESNEPWTTDTDDLFERVLRRQRGTTRWFAIAPGDPSMN